MKNASIGILLIVLVGTRLVADDVADEAQKNWPQWRGPTWNGVASQADPPVIWSETKNLRWKTPIEGRGHGTPIIWGDRVFLLTAIPLDKEMPIPDVIPAGTPNIRVHPKTVHSWKPQRFELVCFDRITGKLRWSRVVHEAMPHQGHHRKAGFASASPVTDGQHIYASFGSFGLYCYDFDGELVWKKDPDPQAMEDGLGEGSSPALFGGLLVIVVDQEQQSYVVALDKKTGKEIWRQDRDEGSNWSTPRIFTHAGRRQVVLNGATVRSYDFATGELLWQCSGQSLGAIPMPAVGHGLVFAASGWRKDTLHAIKLGQRGDLTDSKNVVWSLKRGTPYVPSPMLWGEEIYVLEDQGFFSCFRATDGERHYVKHRLPGILNFSASPVGAADRIYLLSEIGVTVVLQRGPEFKVLAINKLDETFYASPAIVGNSIYLRGNKHLYCFAKGSP
ncbi:MAG: PQQ-binding-like beta-propeller repeat protein [Roseibacillus sp.]|nr:PQQ-binding-like beta-propeller repeat protein [Roseibacillus sp.]